MTAAWQAGTTYVPGDLVKPASGTASAHTQPENPIFATGTLAGWSSSGNWAVNQGFGYSGANSAICEGGGITQLSSTTVVPVSPGQRITAQAFATLTNSGTDDLGVQIGIRWLDGSGNKIGPGSFGGVLYGKGGHWRLISGGGAAPAGAVQAYIEISCNTGSHGGHVNVDAISWDYSYSGVPANLIYKAVQDGPGKSGSAEPKWPAIVGQTVQDNEVTWEAVVLSRIVWQAEPLLESGDTEPDWPMSPGAFVHDGTIDWKALTPQITDPNCPNSAIVQIASGKVFAADNDIIRYCSTVNPLDWSATDDAGYLPFGLQTYGSNPVAAMGLYRSNLVPFNSEGFQMWQLDPDPAAISLVDALPIASTQNKALAPVSNDLLFLAKEGVRSLSLSAASENLEAGDVGMPIDPLVIAALNSTTAAPRATYVPSLGQYWIAVDDGAGSTAFVYTINGGSVGKWSRYTFPFSIDAFVRLGDDLYIRSGDDVLRVDDAVAQDYAGDARAQDVKGIVQWPWLDMGKPGVSKQLIGFDVVGEGQASVQIGYDQSQLDVFTDPFTVPADTVPGHVIPLPIVAPSMSVKLTFSGGQKWRLEAMNLYLRDDRATS